MNWSNQPFDICLYPFIMYNKGWCVRLGQEGGGGRGYMCNSGENYLKYFKRGWNRNKVKENKDFKKGELGQCVDALKRGQLEPPYKLCQPLQEVMGQNVV